MAKRGRKPGDGGRPVGIPNKKAQAIAEKLGVAYPDYDPVLWLAAVAQGLCYSKHQPGAPCDCVPPATAERIACAKEIASYIYPKRKPVDGTGSSDNVHRFAAFPGDDDI